MAERALEQHVVTAARGRPCASCRSQQPAALSDPDIEWRKQWFGRYPFDIGKNTRIVTCGSIPLTACQGRKSNVVRLEISHVAEGHRQADPTHALEAYVIATTGAAGKLQLFACD